MSHPTATFTSNGASSASIDPAVGSVGSVFALNVSQVAALSRAYDLRGVLEPVDRRALFRSAHAAPAEFRITAIRALEQHGTLIGAHVKPDALRAKEARSLELSALAVAYRNLAQALDDESIRLSSDVSTETRGIYGEVRFAVGTKGIPTLRAEMEAMAVIMKKAHPTTNSTAKMIAKAAKKAGKAAEHLERERQREALAARKAKEAKEELARLQAVSDQRMGTAPAQPVVQGAVPAPGAPVAPGAVPPPPSAHA